VHKICGPGGIHAMVSDEVSIIQPEGKIIANVLPSFFRIPTILCFSTILLRTGYRQH